jgi:hypothetical protein
MQSTPELAQKLGHKLFPLLNVVPAGSNTPSLTTSRCSHTDAKNNLVMGNQRDYRFQPQKEN